VRLDHDSQELPRGGPASGLVQPIEDHLEGQAGVATSMTRLPWAMTHSVSRSDLPTTSTAALTTVAGIWPEFAAMMERPEALKPGRRLEEAGADVHRDDAADPRFACGRADDEAAAQGEPQQRKLGQGEVVALLPS
jgi:hypothetical protein